jgi:hypothetical protein
MEFSSLNVEWEEWLYDRFAEIRKLVKIALRHDQSEGTLWIDKLNTIDQLIQNVNN